MKHRQWALAGVTRKFGRHLANQGKFCPFNPVRQNGRQEHAHSPKISSRISESLKNKNKK